MTPNAADATLLKGHLDALLLAVLEPGPQHCYAVIERCAPAATSPSICRPASSTRRCSGWNGPGLITSDWHTVAGRRRRAYHLTRIRTHALGQQRATWDQFSTAVTAVLGKWPRPAIA